MKTKDEIAILKIAVISILLTIIFLGALKSCNAEAKEPPLIVPLDKLAEYDGVRVAVKGWIRSEEYFKGRLGSDNLAHKFGNGETKIWVYSSFLTHSLNKEVIVIGVYQEQGRFAGQLVDHFIIAETVVQE